MALNNSIRSRSPSPAPSVVQNAVASATSAGAMQNIQSITTTSETMATNAVGANTDAQPASEKDLKILLGISRCNHTFFNSGIKKLTAQFNETLANKNSGIEARHEALQQLEKKLSESIKDLDSAISDLESQLAQFEASQGKEKITDFVGQMKELSEQAYTTLLDCKEAVIATEALPEQDGIAKASTFVEIVTNLELYELMPESFSAAYHQSNNAFLDLLESSDNLSTEEQAKWRDLAKEARHLRAEMQNTVIEMSKYIDIVEAEIDIDASDDNLAVRTRLVEVHDNILRTFKQAKKDRFPDVSPTEHSAGMHKRYHDYFSRHDSLVQRKTSVEDNLERINSDANMDETEKKNQLSTLFGERKMISREALSMVKSLEVFIEQVNSQRHRDRLSRISASLLEIDAELTAMLPSVDFTPTERLRFEGFNSPENMALEEIPSGRSTPSSAKPKKGLRFSPTVEVTEVERYIVSEKAVSEKTVNEKSARPAKEAFTAKEASIESTMSGVGQGEDIANLDDFNDDFDVDFNE